MPNAAEENARRFDQIQQKAAAQSLIREQVSRGDFFGRSLGDVINAYAAFLQEIFGFPFAEAAQVAAAEVPGIFPPNELNLALGTGIPAEQPPPTGGGTIVGGGTTAGGGGTAGGGDTATTRGGALTGGDAIAAGGQDFRRNHNVPIRFDFGSDLGGQAVFDESFRRGIFRDDPAFAFETALTEAGLPKQGSEVFRRRAGDFLGQFEGQLGREFAGTGQFQPNPLDFFRGLNFAEQLAGFGPRERGETPSLFNPRTRSLFF